MNPARLHHRISRPARFWAVWEASPVAGQAAMKTGQDLGAHPPAIGTSRPAAAQAVLRAAAWAARHLESGRRALA